MGWSSDWLYKLLLNRARDTLAEASQAALKRSEPAPIMLLATEHPDYHPESNMTRGQPIRAWSSNDDFSSLQDLSQWPPNHKLPATAGQSIYCVPMLTWSLTADRKQVLICRWIGPRYASGAWWDVLGQGRTGSLSIANRERWIS